MAHGPEKVLPAIALLALFACADLPTNGNLTVPSGFEVEMVAGSPLVERPMIIDMDEQGRLYVAESSGSTDSIEQQLAERPHSILRLEDRDGDGKFDRRTVFADKMMLPEGVLWHNGSVYVSAPPQIWKLTDTNDDGVADEREVWFDGKTLTGCANDLHGPYLGPEGWIYWTKGAFAEQTYERPGRSPLVTRAAHIFRRRPEGGPVEVVLTGGMDNPIEVAFSSEGERFLTSTFTEHPKLGRRDGLLHALYGGVYGKIHGVTDNHPMTGGFNDVMTQMDATVPVGLARYESSAFGEEYRGDLFATLFNTHKVTRHKLIPVGATFRTEDSDFLVSDSYDFHPTDVMEDADGSLLIVDTGAWYKICCPSAQLAKPEVLGAIYRVRRKDSPTIEDPRGDEIDWTTRSPEELVALLGDDRSVVRKRAIRLLAQKDFESIEALRNVDGAVEARRNALWALTRIPGEEAREAVREVLADPEESVRHVALHSVSVWRDRGALEPALEQLRRGSNAIQRVAAEALGRLGDSTAVPDLLAASATDDEALFHSLTYALIEIADPVATRRGLNAPAQRTRRAALIALDQMEPKTLKPDEIVPLLSSSEPTISTAAEWIASQHPEWGGELAGYFRSRMGDPSFVSRIARFTGDPAIQRMLAEEARGSGTSKSRVLALNAMARAPVDEPPGIWSEALIAALTADAEEVVAAAVAAARRLPRPESGDEPLDAALLGVASNAAARPLVRAEAAESSIKSAETVPEGLFAFLLDLVEPSGSVALRGASARALAAAPLSEAQLFRLASSLATAGPMELPALVKAFSNGSSAELGREMLRTLEGASGLANLRPDVLEAAAAPYPVEIQEGAQALLADREVDRDAQRRKVEQLVETVRQGDARRGQTVFNSADAACSSCHRIGFQGGEIGPNLSRIGRIRTARDLLESIVYPSLSFVRSYEPIVAITASGVHSGVTIEETDTHLLLATGVDEQVRIARADIEEIRPGSVSIMPSGLDEQLSKQQLADLVVFLKDTAYKPWQRP